MANAPGKSRAPRPWSATGDRRSRWHQARVDDVGTGRAGGPGGKPTTADQPVGTLMTQNHRAVATAFMAQMNGGFNTTFAKGMDEPLTTVTNTGSQQQLT